MKAKEIYFEKLINGRKVTKPNTAKSARKLFKNLHSLMVKVDFINSNPVAIDDLANRLINMKHTRLEQSQMGYAEMVGIKQIHLDFLKDNVVIELSASEFKSLAIQYLGLMSKSYFLNELVLDEAVGCHNWQIPGLSDKLGFKSLSVFYVSKSEWDSFYDRMGPVFELLSKKQKMDDDRYIAAATSILRSIMDKLGM